MTPASSKSQRPGGPYGRASIFSSPVVDRLRETGRWDLPGGSLLLPKVSGFCRGVTRALAMLEQACDAHGGQGRLFLLGQIIHNPWVNDYFQRRGVRLLEAADLENLEQLLTARDVAVIPAFGVHPAAQQRLASIGCRVIDTSCGDVRRLWKWAEQEAAAGYGVFIFGRAGHDETVVTKSRLAQAGGRYVIAGKLEQVRDFCDMVTARAAEARFGEVFPPESTNADGIEPFSRLAQVSQTTMLHSETMEVRAMIRGAFEERYGPAGLDQRLKFQPTVCRATQDRQAAAVELCRSGLDLVIVVGGFGSSNTRHLYELARSYAPGYFIEDAQAILDERRLRTVEAATQQPAEVIDWLPARRPLRIGVLAGASTPESAVGAVLERLAGFLGA
jgi:4-hydroxy-3-methylbut-2-enyl diphosphate reductase